MSDLSAGQKILPVAETSDGRLAYLEALRGIAALSVVLGHILAAIALRGYPATVVLAALRTPLAIAVDGRGAVIFFFTLSGYVLTLRSLQTRNPRAIIQGAIKRWPRLAGPVLLTTIISSVLWQTGLYFCSAAAHFTGSDWLARFAYAFLGLNAIPDMGLAAAVREGAVLAFVHGESYFDSSLWTMTYEFYGSFAVFLSAYLILVLPSPAARAASLVIVFSIMVSYSWLYLPFGVGLALAWRHARGVTWAPRSVAVCLVIFAVYVFGFRQGQPFYAWLYAGPADSDFMTVSFTVASLAVLIGITAWPRARRLLSGRVGRQLGSLSFPIYLLHVPIIMSAGCAVYLAVEPTWGTNRASAALACMTLAAAVSAAYLLALIDRHWARIVNRMVARFTRFLPLPAEAAGSAVQGRPFNIAAE